MCIISTYVLSIFFYYQFLFFLRYSFVTHLNLRQTINLKLKLLSFHLLYGILFFSFGFSFIFLLHIWGGRNGKREKIKKIWLSHFVHFTSFCMSSHAFLFINHSIYRRIYMLYMCFIYLCNNSYDKSFC